MIDGIADPGTGTTAAATVALADELAPPRGLAEPTSAAFTGTSVARTSAGGKCEKGLSVLANSPAPDNSLLKSIANKSRGGAGSAPIALSPFLRSDSDTPRRSILRNLPLEMS